MTSLNRKSFIAPTAILILVLLSVSPFQQARAATPTVITAVSSQTPVKIDGIVEQGEWNASQTIAILGAGMTVAFEYNSTGLLFLLQWKGGSGACSTPSCFGGIEIGSLNNTADMGSALNPTIMVLLSTSFNGSSDEFVSYGDSTPPTVESLGYESQSTCALVISGTAYTGECYRPFALNNPSPYDPFPTLVAGSSIELGFAVGNFAVPGQHLATNMVSYVLKLGPAGTTTGATTSSTAQVSTSATQNPPAGPDVSNYWLELAVIVVGFSLFIMIVTLRYQRS